MLFTNRVLKLNKPLFKSLIYIYIFPSCFLFLFLFLFFIISLCLENGWHTRTFRTALLCPIKKPGERDKMSPRSYRLISLLSVLGKGLERIVACRLAWTTVTIT